MRPFAPAKGCGCSRQRRPAPIRRRGGGLRRAGGAANGSEGAGASESWWLPRAWPGGARVACDRRGRVSLLPPPSLRSDGEPSWGRGRPPAETSSRLEMVLLCPFGMSHVGRAMYQCKPTAPRSGFATNRRNRFLAAPCNTPPEVGSCGSSGESPWGLQNSTPRARIPGDPPPAFPPLPLPEALASTCLAYTLSSFQSRRTPSA